MNFIFYNYINNLIVAGSPIVAYNIMYSILYNTVLTYFDFSNFINICNIFPP